MLKYYLDKTGKVIKSILFPSSEFVDTEPREGSMNPVTSGGVAGSVAQQSSNLAPNYTKKTYEANSYVMQDGVLYTNPNAIGTAEDWNPAHWTQTTVAETNKNLSTIIDVLPEGASAENKLVDQATLDEATAAWNEGYTPKGPASVSTLNGLSGQENGDRYVLTDGGTLTDGSVVVAAGDEVAWDATGSKWYKVNQYALEQNVSAIEEIVYNKVIELVGFGTNGASAGVTQIGDIYYNTNTKLLREQVGVGEYETVPFESDANYLNLSDGKNYIYDGTGLAEHAKTNRIDFLESNLFKTVVKTLDDVEKRNKGVFVSYTYPDGPYSMNSNSDSWESWVVDASELISISATLGRSTSAQCNIIFLSSAVMEVSSIISHASPDPITADGVINYTVDSIPQGCKYVLISNRIATYQSPSATLNYKQSTWGRVDEVEKGFKKADEKLEQQIDFRKPLFYKCQDKITSVPTYANLIAAYDEIAGLYSDFVTKNDLGVSSDGVNHLYEYVITTGNYNTEGERIPDAEIQKPKILLMSGIHGYEPGSVMSLYLFVKSIFENVLFNKILYSFETHIIPVVNPYGYNNDRRGNYNNVDINRNFDAMWELSGDPTANPSYYSGPSAASEAETVIVQDWIDANTDAVVCVDFHNSSFEEVACLGGSSDEANEKIKKLFLHAMDSIEKYVRTDRSVSDSYIMAYTYGSAGYTKGGSRAYMNKVDLVTGNVLETCSYTNALQTPDYNSIGLGAECLGNFVLNVVDYEETNV